MVINKLNKANGQPVTVKINSPGGSVFAASEIYTELRNYSGDVIIEIVGMAASAASVVAMARKSKMSPTAQLMVHNVSTSNQGDYRSMEHTAEVLRNANDTIANAYIAKTGMSRKEALKLMDNTTYLSAYKAKELGLIDEVMFEDNNNLNLTNTDLKGLYNGFTSIPYKLLENLNNRNGNQPLKNNGVDFFMQQKAKSELEFLKLKERI